MKLSPAARWGLLVGTLLFAALLYAALNWFEFVDDREWTGASGEARTNPYLAVQRLFTKLEAPPVIVRASEELDRLPANATLILGDRRLSRMTAKRIQYIKQWVEQGGRLVVEAEQPRYNDPLLKAYGIQRKRLVWTTKDGLVERPLHRSQDADVDDNDEDDFESEIEEESLFADIFRRVLEKPKPADFTLANGEVFSAVFRPYQNLEATNPPEGAYIGRDPHGIRLIEFASGKGYVTILTNFDFMVRQHIEEADHAALAWRLVGEPGPSTPIIFSAQLEAPSLANWLWQNVWMTIAGLVMLLLLWIARILPRFGPLIPDTAPARRNLAEHWQAAGRYLARQSDWHHLLLDARLHFQARLKRRHPVYAAMPPDQQVTALAHATAMPEAFVEKALMQGADSPATFLDAIHKLFALSQVLALERRTAKPSSSPSLSSS